MTVKWTGAQSSASQEVSFDSKAKVALLNCSELTSVKKSKAVAFVNRISESDNSPDQVLITRKLSFYKEHFMLTANYKNYKKKHQKLFEGMKKFSVEFKELKKARKAREKAMEGAICLSSFLSYEEIIDCQTAESLAKYQKQTDLTLFLPRPKIGFIVGGEVIEKFSVHPN